MSLTTSAHAPTRNDSRFASLLIASLHRDGGKAATWK